MTQLKDMAAPTSETARVLDAATLHEAIRRYLANPVFRAARYEELVLDDNPYRRPVRPDDIGLVDFSTPLDRDSFAQLSGLMGHRMLLNIHDARTLLLPAQPTPEKWQDFQQFYDEANLVLGDLIRPYLEEHLFAFVREEARHRVSADVREVSAHLAELAATRADRAAAVGSLVDASPSRDSLLAMVTLQSVATALNARISSTVELPAPLAAAGGAVELDQLGRQLAEHAGVKYEPHSYYQYYLPSTLARMNYLNAMTQPGRVFRLVGALLAEQVDVAAQAAAYRTLLADRPPTLPAPATGSPASAQVLAEVQRAGGDFGVRELSRGLAEYAVLLEVQHDDYLRQLSWIDNMPAYQDKARRLQRAIEEHQIPVHLDTFVESWEECSTTHVHDEDRLLIIESGEMEFWNCFGARHSYVPGDMAFVPKHRLHGSVVLSGECVYHQPVITPELDARFG